MWRHPQQECAPDPELVGNAMVDAIGREPIHLRHFDIEERLDIGADVFETERLLIVKSGGKTDQSLHPT